MHGNDYRPGGGGIYILVSHIGKCPHKREIIPHCSLSRQEENQRAVAAEQALKVVVVAGLARPEEEVETRPQHQVRPAHHPLVELEQPGRQHNIAGSSERTLRNHRTPHKDPRRRPVGLVAVPQRRCTWPHIASSRSHQALQWQ